MSTDRFWPIFWIIFGAVALGCLVVSGSLFFVHIASVDAAALGITFDPNKDPFDSQTRGGGFGFTLTDGWVYREALPVGLSQWAWDATLDWSSADQRWEGGRSLKMTFAKDWAGMGVSGFSANVHQYQTLLFALRPDASVGDLYLQVYDDHDRTLVRQSLSWYANDGTLTPGQWNQLAIPLANLIGSSSTSVITGITIYTTHPGVAYLDAVQFSATPTVHETWVPPQWFDGPPFNPFATSTPVSLPYTLDMPPSSFERWYSYHGYLGLGQKGLLIGPTAGSNTDSVAAFRGGRFWDNYQVSAVVDWGPAQAFSLLVRFADESNFVSCAYGGYGQTVTLYDVHDGVSTQLAQSPTLAIPFYEPWTGVDMSAEVAGRRVTCFVRGERAISMEIPDIQSVGTVGMEAWDPNFYSQPHTLRELTVKPLVGE